MTNTILHAPRALLPDGWAHDVRVGIDASGRIGEVERDSPPRDGDRLLYRAVGRPRRPARHTDPPVEDIADEIANAIEECMNSLHGDWRVADIHVKPDAWDREHGVPSSARWYVTLIAAPKDPNKVVLPRVITPRR